jgi:hypothetical protein
MLFNSNAFTLLTEECHYFRQLPIWRVKIQNPKLIGFELFND